MLVGVAFLPPSILPSRTQAFYIIKRQNCVYFCNRVYVQSSDEFELSRAELKSFQVESSRAGHLIFELKPSWIFFLDYSFFSSIYFSWTKIRFGIIRKSPPQNFVVKTLAGACKEELHRKRRIENKVALPATTISPL